MKEKVDLVISYLLGKYGHVISIGMVGYSDEKCSFQINIERIGLGYRNKYDMLEEINYYLGNIVYGYGYNFNLTYDDPSIVEIYHNL